MQCPHCTFYKVESTYTPVEIGRKKDPSTLGVTIAIIICLVVWFIGLGVVGFFGSIMKSNSVGMLSILWSIGCIIACVLLIRNELSLTSPIYESHYVHECKHCGYTWRV